jgi:Porin subfamily
MTRILLGVFLLSLAAILPSTAGEMAFGKAKPVPLASPARGDHCVAQYGEGFADLGGTGACVKIGGRVRADFGATTGGRRFGADSAPLPFAPTRSAFGTAADGAVDADLRANADGQPLRVFGRVRGASGTLPDGPRRF